tara:strand:- start:93 stop:785 length:693 start_codon:yes stop_codon:yes gene_type:complete
MTTQKVSCQLMLSTGESVNLGGTFTDGTESELQTTGVVSAGGGVSAQSIGVYAENKSIVSIIQPVTAENKIVYAYISRRGEILKCLPVASGTVSSEPYPCQVLLQAGDTIRVLTKASITARDCAYNVVTNRGVNAIFTVTPSGAATNELTHILTGQSIGSSLQNQMIISHFTNSSDGAKYRGGSVLVLNDRGLPVGTSLAVNQNNLQVLPSMFGTCGINLNFKAVAITTS